MFATRLQAQWPAYWTIEEWVAGLHKFITTVLKTKKVSDTQTVGGRRGGMPDWN